MPIFLQTIMRSLFRAQKPRRCPRRGPKPGIGAQIAHNEFRMTIQAGFSEALWEWLMDQGWRELVRRPERRHYRQLSAAWVTELFDAPEQDWPRILSDAIEQASYRPIVGDPGSVPPYVTRH